MNNLEFRIEYPCGHQIPMTMRTPELGLLSLLGTALPGFKGCNPP